MRRLWRKIKRFFRRKPTPAPKPEPTPTPVKPIETPVGLSFHWNNKDWDSILINALKKSKLMTLVPEDFLEFGSIKNPIEFWGNILVEMARWESSFDPSTEYKESFGVWSRGLFQLSLSDKANYKGIEFTTEESVHDPKLNIEAAVLIMEKLVSQDMRIAGKSGGKWKGGARYWSVLRGTRSYTEKALKAIKEINDQEDRPSVSDNGIYGFYPGAIFFDDLPKLKTPYVWQKKVGEEYIPLWPEVYVVHFTAGWQTRTGREFMKSFLKRGLCTDFLDENGQIFLIKITNFFV